MNDVVTLYHSVRMQHLFCALMFPLQSLTYGKVSVILVPNRCPFRCCS